MRRHDILRVQAGMPRPRPRSVPVNASPNHTFSPDVDVLENKNKVPLMPPDSVASLKSPLAARRAFVMPGQMLTFILITSLFFAWGLAANMTETLLAAFKRILSLSDFQTTFVQYAFFGAYFCFAIPASMLVGKLGYKTGILIGLGLYIAGALMFFPASLTLEYRPFLLALYVLAAGLSFLETSANPFIYSLGSPATATQRLNLAQAFNPVGAITGALLAKFFILDKLHEADAGQRAALSQSALQDMQRAELAAVMGPYVGVALVLVVIWITIALRKIPKETIQAFDEQPLGLLSGLKRLLASKRYVTAVIVQFLYVGGQVGVWSFTIRYVMDRLGVNEGAAANYYTVALVLFFVSRFLCTWLMSIIRPEHLLSGLGGLAVALCLTAAMRHDIVGVYALVGVSGCMSLMFPTIYGMGLAGLGADTKLGGAGLVMAIVGGAVMVGIQGAVSDATGNIGYAFFVSALCFAAVMVFGLTVRGTADAGETPAGHG